MVLLIQNAKKYFLQNYRGEHTLDASFEGASFTKEELEELRKYAGEYVEKCEIRA